MSEQDYKFMMNTSLLRGPCHRCGYQPTKKEMLEHLQYQKDMVELWRKLRKLEKNPKRHWWQ
jgi:hypothetical protein